MSGGFRINPILKRQFSDALCSGSLVCNLMCRLPNCLEFKLHLNTKLNTLGFEIRPSEIWKHLKTGHFGSLDDTNHLKTGHFDQFSNGKNKMPSKLY